MDALRMPGIERLTPERSCNDPPSSDADLQGSEHQTPPARPDCQLTPGSALGFLLNDVSRLFRQAFETVVEEAGLALTAGEVRSLSYVAAYRGSRQTSLAAHMGIRPMTISAYIDGLERHGLVARSQDPTDRRAKIVCITDKGEFIFESLRTASHDVYHRSTRTLSMEQIRTMELALRVALKNLSECN